MRRLLRRLLGDDERGATAILMAFVLILLLGIAAIAIDLGFGFNERRQSQTAADMAVMAGATEVVLGGDQQAVVAQVLAFARANVNTTYADAEWQALWKNCSDPDRLGFDVGTGIPVDFQPLPEPTAWGTGDLECISEVASYLRVRVPDQIIDTSFGKVLGINNLATSAAAVARIEAGGALGAVLPFGIPGGTANGEICLRSSGSGTAFPPCSGPSAGGFGTINSEFFGDFHGTATCSNPGHTEMAQNIALGIDHAVSTWPESAANFHGVWLGSPHPGTPTVRNYQEIGFDDCSIVGGSVVPANPGHVSPPNALRVDTGFSPDPVEEGLVSNQTFHGENSRLQQGTNPKRPLVKQRQGAINTVYNVDNKGLWDYLNPSNSLVGLPQCDGNTYSGLTVDEKVLRMHQCLGGYPTNATQDIFQASIADSPRLVWAPEYWHAASTSGAEWQPVYRFRLTFLAGTWYNCSGTTCGVVFYPDLASTGEMCDASGPSNCSALSLAQISGYLLPTEAVPEGSIPPFPGADTAFGATLFR